MGKPLMVLVSMDVEAMRDATARMDRFVQDAREGWSRARSAADRAMLPTVHTNLVLEEQVDQIEQLQRELTARADLMELVNGSAGTRSGGGMVHLEMPQGDSVFQVRRTLGAHLAAAGRSLDTLSSDAVQDFSALLARNLSDGDVMAAFYDTLGVHDLLELMTQATLSPVDNALPLLENLKRGLDTADDRWGDDQRRLFAGHLVDAATSSQNLPTRSSHFSAALTYLLHESTYSSAFLATSATHLDAVERSYPVVEGHWAVGPVGRDLWARLYASGPGAVTWDPMTALMGALATNPDEALRFFSGPDRDARFVHYLRDRSWSGDDFDAIAAALDSAATTFHTLDDPRATDAAWVASATVNYFGQRPYIGEAGKDSLGHLLAHHVVSIERVAIGRGEGLGVWTAFPDDTAGPQPPGADFENGHLRSVLYSVLQDRSAMTAVRQAINSYTAARLSPGADTVDGDYESSGTGAFVHATKDVAGLNGYVLGAMNAGKEMEAKAQTENVRGFLGFTDGLVGMLPLPGQAVGWVAGRALEYAATGGASTWSDALARVENESKTSEQVLQRDIQAAVGVALIEASRQPSHGSGVDPIEYPWHTNRRFDRTNLEQPEVRKLFSDWVSDKGLQNLLGPDIRLSLASGYSRGRGEAE